MAVFDTDVEQCLAVLQQGGVILYPTDTVWGLGCDATNGAAVRKLLDLKGKPSQKGLIVLLSSERDIMQYVAAPDPLLLVALPELTRPTTVIYENGLNVADEVLNADGSLAIRLVKEDFCRHLLKRFKKPIVSTSANYHGEPSPGNFVHISEQMKNSVDYIVNHRRDESLAGVPSAMARWNRGYLEYLRQ